MVEIIKLKEKLITEIEEIKEEGIKFHQYLLNQDEKEDKTLIFLKWVRWECKERVM